MLRFFSGIVRSSLLGVDLGSSSIKIVGLSGKKVSVAAFLDISSKERDDEIQLINRLRDFFSTLNIIGREAAIHIPGTLSFVRTINLPLMPPGELKEAVRWEIKRHLPYPVEEAVFDYVADEIPDGIAVTFASAERKDVQAYIFPFKESGLNVVAIDISPLALIRALKPQEQGNIVLLDIGARNMEINIIKGSILRLTRTVEMGGEDIINYLIEEGTSQEESLRILINGHSDKMRDILNQLLREVSRSMDYYKANFKERSFSGLMLTGGVSLNPHIKEYFSQVLNIPVSVPNPFNGFYLKDESVRAFGPRFSIAVGLARREG